MTQRLRIDVRGRVQGVGFRPWVYQLALRYQLTGWVKNTGDGVIIEVQGLDTPTFLSTLRRQPSRLTDITEMTVESIATADGETDFQIIMSDVKSGSAQMPADMAVCDDCLRELFDPDNRFYLYPFINCTHCGPRYSIIHRLPYDRQHTAMASFPMCGACLTDYRNPHSRRYHAQAIACAQCGPQLSLPVAQVAQQIQAGQIIALKSLGGYQLIADARQPTVVNRLRHHKQRTHKPFAVMMANMAAVSRVAVVNDIERQQLIGEQRPIVLLQATAPYMTHIAPELNRLGVMLPYTPVHHLLFHYLGDDCVLLVTSANDKSQPLIVDDEQAHAQLNSIADSIVGYNRPIVSRVDDSVVKVIDKQSIFIRRARGFVPEPIELPRAVPSVLALGGHLKNTICITRDNQAFVSPHIGDIDNAQTIDVLHDTIARWLRYLAVTPECVAHDLHPDFYTTQLAQQFGKPTQAVQHHHAHLAAVVAEHRIQQPCLGLILDGYGYGEHGEALGGELLLYRAPAVEHLGCLRPLPLPGGAQAAKEPWRMGLSVLHQLNKLTTHVPARYSHQPLAAQVIRLLQKQLHCPPSSGAGRLFDAASSLLGVCHVNRYEGQAAMLLESLVTGPVVLSNGWRRTLTQLDVLPLMAHLLHCDPVTGANVFHGTLAAALADWLLLWARQSCVNLVVLAGGCMVNQPLVTALRTHCQQAGLTVLLPGQLPPNDGGLCLGQAWLAALNRR
jgi:hydrogenase maturation protein HypF